MQKAIILGSECFLKCARYAWSARVPWLWAWLSISKTCRCHGAHTAAYTVKQTRVYAWTDSLFLPPQMSRNYIYSRLSRECDGSVRADAKFFFHGNDTGMNEWINDKRHLVSEKKKNTDFDLMPLLLKPDGDRSSGRMITLQICEQLCSVLCSLHPGGSLHTHLSWSVLPTCSMLRTGHCR